MYQAKCLLKSREISCEGICFQIVFLAHGILCLSVSHFISLWNIFLEMWYFLLLKRININFKVILDFMSFRPRFLLWYGKFLIILSRYGLNVYLNGQVTLESSVYKDNSKCCVTPLQICNRCNVFPQDFSFFFFCHLTK